MDGLIARYLAGEALPEEAMQLDEWIASSGDNEAYFNDCMKAFPAVFHAGSDSKTLYHNVRTRLEMHAKTKRKQNSKVFKLNQYATPIRIAATVAVISWIGLMIAVLVKHNSKQHTLIASSSQTKQQTLTDGSIVFMNKHSRISVEGRFNHGHRKVRLDGEAFFEVKHNDEAPFVVDAGGVTITDVGTAFNVKALPWSDSVMVAVTEGVVEMSNGVTSLRVKEGESAIYVRTGKKLLPVRSANLNIASYKTRVFRFRAAPLRDVISSLNDVYGPLYSIQNDSLGACRITVDFRNEAPETIAGVIAETLGLTYENAGTGYLIKGSTCVQ